MKKYRKICCLLTAAIAFLFFIPKPVFCGNSSAAETFLTEAKTIRLKHITPEIWQKIREQLHCIETSNVYYSADDNHISDNSTGAFGTSKTAIRQIMRGFGRGWAGKDKDPIDMVRSDDEIYEYFSMAYADYVWKQMESCPRFNELPVEKKIEDLAVYGWYLPAKYCRGNFTPAQKKNIEGRIKRLKQCQARGPLPQRNELMQLAETEGVAEFKFSDFEEYFRIQLSDRFIDLDNDRILLPVKVGLHMAEKGSVRAVRRALYMDWQVINVNNPTPFNTVEDIE